VLEGRSASYGQATPYLPVLDLLKAYFQLDDRDDGRRIREKLTGRLLALSPTLAPTLPAFLALLEVPGEDASWQLLDPSQRRQRTLDALKHLLLRESQVQPLLLVFENLHWTDTETQAFLDGLVESLPAARLLLLVNFRPEYQHSWGQKTYFTQLRLDPLSPPSAETLLESLLGNGVSLASLKERLIQLTQGNPFFLEESIRTLIETRALVGERGAYRLAKVLPSIQVPATVQAILAARIDRLPPEEKSLLQTAAVIGTEVPLGLLQAITEMREEALRLALTHLQRTEFLYETQLFPELVYSFKHVLTSEVAYGSLLQEHRRALHARIVEALEGGNPTWLLEQGDRRAHHAFRGELWEKAVAYSQQVGNKAYDRGALREAVTNYEQALDAIGYLPETPDTRLMALELRHLLGHVLSLQGEYPRSLALLGEAETLARRVDDRARLGQVLCAMSLVCRIQGDLDGAVAAGRQALEMVASLDDSTLQAEASYRLGQAYFVMGDFGQAAVVLRGNVEALAPSAPGPARYWEIVSRAWLAWVLSALGEFAEGKRHGEEALRLAMEEEHRTAPIIAHGGLGLLYLAQGDLEAAVRVLERGLALCRTSGSKDWLPTIAGALGEAYAYAGRLAQGLALVEEALQDDVCTGALSHYPPRARQLSAVYLLAGRLAEARSYVDQALDLARRHQEHGYEAHALFQLGAVQAHAAPPMSRGVRRATRRR
jgi:tetratricopeptide (TPR) repeat protein